MKLDKDLLLAQLHALKAEMEKSLERGDWLWASTPNQVVDCVVFLLAFLGSAPIDKSLEKSHES